MTSPIRVTKPTCVDIYCGAGGTTYGAMQAGLHVAYGLDVDKNAIATFARNHPDAFADGRDVAAVTAKEILHLAKVDHVDFLLSGPNCQAVSQMGLFWKDDPRNLMFTHLARLIDEFVALGKGPEHVLIENVPSIAFKKNISIVQDLVKFFRERGYACAADVVNFASWGLPQLRHRFVLMASRQGNQPTLPAPVASLVGKGEGLVTTWQAISDLANIPPVEVRKTVDAAKLATPTDYQRAMRGSGGKKIHNHHKGTTAAIDIERIRHVPPGGGWKDIPEHLLPERFRRVRMTDYKTLYGRLLKNHPSYTIYGAYGNVTSGCFTHPIEDRPLTVREGCRLQGFDDDFVVTGSLASQYKQIGNAVPAYAAKVLLNHWQAQLNGDNPDSVPLRLNEELLFATEPPRLPVLTPRYRRIGYGSGTYWPKGWGEEPPKRLTAADGYRITTDPVVFRRAAWRTQRDERMTESLNAVRTLDWSAMLTAMKERPEDILLLDGIDTSDGRGAGRDLARQRFMRFLAPAGATLAAVANEESSVIVHCDFGITADWLQKFLGYLVDDGQCHVNVLNDGGGATEPTNSWATVRLTTNGGIARKEMEGTRLVLARPFAGLHGVPIADSALLPSPDSGLRARACNVERAALFRHLHGTA